MIKLLVTCFRHYVNSREKPIAKHGHRVFSPKSGLRNPTARRQRKGKQNNNFARASNVFVYFFLSFLHGYDVKMRNNVGSRALYRIEKVSFSYGL